MTRIGKQWTWLLARLAAAACMMSFSSCSLGDAGISIERTPDRQVRWTGGDLGLWGSSGDTAYAVSGEPPVLEVWRWENALTKRLLNRPLPRRPLAIAMVSENRFVEYDYDSKSKRAFFTLRKFGSDDAAAQWEAEKEWCDSLSRASRDGKHVAVWGFPDVGSRDLGKNVVRIGMLSSQFDRVEWITTMTGKLPMQTIRRVAMSDDGAYIGFAGWEHGAAVVDVAKKNVLWEKCPTDEVAFNDLAFSPDSELVYAGGTEGCVYGMRVDTGEIVSRWFATVSGKSEAGWRISTISVSPDGKLVAAGTGPAGFVFVFSRQQGKLVRTIEHGGSTILITCFSPDSLHLATFAADKIKIWAMSSKR